MKKKSRIEILRNRLERMGESSELHPEMPEDVAEAFIAELRFDPDCGAIAARDWRPDHRNEQPWIKGFLDGGRRSEALQSPGDDDVVNCVLGEWGAPARG